MSSFAANTWLFFFSRFTALMSETLSKAIGHRTRSRNKGSPAWRLICEITSWIVDRCNYCTIPFRSSKHHCHHCLSGLPAAVSVLSPSQQKIQVAFATNHSHSAAQRPVKWFLMSSLSQGRVVGSNSEIGHVPILAGRAHTRKEDNPLKLSSGRINQSSDRISPWPI